MSLNENVELMPHQQNAVKKTLDRDGSMLFYHDVGTGKTLSGIASVEALKRAGKAKKALVVVPSSLRENFAQDGVKKFTDNSYFILGNKQELNSKRKDVRDINALTSKNSADYNIVSYNLFQRDPEKYIKNTGADTVVYDEIHRAKNESSNITKVIKDARKHHRNFIGLTGSLTSNTPADMVPLVDGMTDGKHILGSKASFEGRFLNVDSNGKKSLKNKTVLKAIASPYVDFVDRNDLNGFEPPRRKRVVHDIVMGAEQSDVYRSAIDKIDAATKVKLALGVGKLSEKELKHIGNKLMGARQASNAPHTVLLNMSVGNSYEHSAKAKALVSNVKKHLNETKDGQVIVGTQFIKGGIDVLSHGLNKEHIPFSTFIGKGNKGVSEKSRTKAVDDFNAGKAKVILISSAGGEGLNLPNTTAVHMMDGHFNPEVVNQMEARGVRAGGLSHRKKEDRVVELNRYIAKPDVKVTSAAESIGAMLNPMTYLGRALAGQKILQAPEMRAFSADALIDEVSNNKNNNNSEIKGMFKTAKYLGSESEIMNRYYDDVGADRVSASLGTGKYIDREKEEKYIKELKNLYSSISKSKRYGIIEGKGAFHKFDKTDFDDDGEMKLRSWLSPSKNVAIPPLIGGLAAGGLAIVGNKQLRPKLKSHRSKEMLEVLLATAASTGGTVGLISGYIANAARGNDYSGVSKPKARVKLKLSNEDTLRLLRGESVTKETVKRNVHALG